MRPLWTLLETTGIIGNALAVRDDSGCLWLPMASQSNEFVDRQDVWGLIESRGYGVDTYSYIMWRGVGCKFPYRYFFVLKRYT